MVSKSRSNVWFKWIMTRRPRWYATECSSTSAKNKLSWKVGPLTVLKSLLCDVKIQAYNDYLITYLPRSLRVFLFHFHFPLRFQSCWFTEMLKRPSWGSTIMQEMNKHYSQKEKLERNQAFSSLRNFVTRCPAFRRRPYSNSASSWRHRLKSTIEKSQILMLPCIRLEFHVHGENISRWKKRC